MNAFPAEVPEIIRSWRLDEEIWLGIASKLSESLTILCGSQVTIKFNQLIVICSKFAYFVITTGLGFQSLGEEYLALIQTVPGTRNIPTFNRRFFSIVLLSFGFPLISCILKLLYTKVESQQLRQFFHDAQTKLSMIERVNLALFYCSGAYHRISLRICSIKYLTLRPNVSSVEILNFFKLLGCLSLIQYTIDGFLLCINNIRSKSCRLLQTINCSAENNFATILGDAAKTTSKVSYAINLKCAVCFDCGGFKNQEITFCSAVCGHVFCWNCIYEYLKGDNACPICRQSIVLPSRLIPLMNF